MNFPKITDGATGRTRAALEPEPMDAFELRLQQKYGFPPAKDRIQRLSPHQALIDETRTRNMMIDQRRMDDERDEARLRRTHDAFLRKATIIKRLTCGCYTPRTKEF